MKYYCKGVNILFFREGQNLVVEKDISFENYEECLSDLFSWSTFTKHAWQHNFVTVSRYHDDHHDKTNNTYFSNPHIHPQYGWLIIVTRSDQTKEIFESSCIYSSYDMAEEGIFPKIIDICNIANQSMKHGENKPEHGICHLDFHVTVTFSVYE